MTSPHQLLNPPALATPSGFSHAVVARPGRTVYLAGQTAQRLEGPSVNGSLAEQFEAAAANTVEALRAAGAQPEHLVSMQIFTTDIRAYRASLTELGRAYRKHFGRHYPAVSLFEVRSLFDSEALVELICVAVIPEP